MRANGHEEMRLGRRRLPAIYADFSRLPRPHRTKHDPLHMVLQKQRDVRENGRQLVAEFAEFELVRVKWIGSHATAQTPCNKACWVSTQSKTAQLAASAHRNTPAGIHANRPDARSLRTPPPDRRSRPDGAAPRRRLVRNAGSAGGNVRARTPSPRPPPSTPTTESASFLLPPESHSPRRNRHPARACHVPVGRRRHSAPGARSVSPGPPVPGITRLAGELDPPPLKSSVSQAAVLRKAARYSGAKAAGFTSTRQGQPPENHRFGAFE